MYATEQRFRAYVVSPHSYLGDAPHRPLSQRRGPVLFTSGSEVRSMRSERRPSVDPKVRTGARQKGGDRHTDCFVEVSDSRVEVGR